MTAQTEQKKTPAEVRHLTAEHVADVKKIFGEDVKTAVSRIKWLDSVLAYGVDIKTLSADLTAANRIDPAVPVLGQAILGYYRFPITVAETVGVTLAGWIKRNPAEVQAIYYAGKHAGLKVAGQAIRDAVRSIDAEKKTEREGAAVDAAETLTAKVKPAKKSTPRTGTAKKKTAETGRDVLPAAADATADDVLRAIRYATAALNLGLSHSADLGSAIAELTAAASTARKRGAVKVAATATPATVAAAVAA
jgi:hypothetical protein